MLKKLLLLGALLALVPMDRENQQAIYDVASTTIRDLSGFCERNPEVCNRSSIFVGQLTAKAQIAGTFVYDMVKETANTSTRDDPLGRYIEQEPVQQQRYDSSRRYESVAVRRIDGDPAPASGEERLPAYSERRISNNSGYGTLSGDDRQPAWRGAHY